MSEPINIFVGYDKRESIAYHTFCQSVITRAKAPVSIVPLTLNALQGYTEKHTDGSNDFIYSRFLVPYLMGFKGWAIFVDGDMVCLDDINELYKLRDYKSAVQVVKHNYKTKQHVKYLGAKNEDYPRKNWSSVILWNCGHYKNRILKPEYVATKPGSHLHRFEWLQDDNIGDLPMEWNWLAEEYVHNDHAKLIHYTLGTPCFNEYAKCDHSEEWHKEARMVNKCVQLWTPPPNPLIGKR